MAMYGFPPPLPHALESLAGPGFSNVVLKGFLLCGGHPGGNTSEIVANLTPLLKEGVTSFVCLQPEMPRPWSTNAPTAHAHGQVSHTLTHTHAHGHAHTAATTHTHGYGVATTAHMRSAYAGGNVVTAKNYLADAQAMVDAGGFPQTGGRALGFVHFPIPETSGGTVPDELLKPFLLDLLSYMRAGEYLYMHCGDGNGRSGVVAACLLGLAHNLSSSEALDLMQRSRSDRPGAGGRSPDTHEQKMQVHRILADARLRAAAAAAVPRLVDNVRDDADAAVAAVTEKIRSVLSRKGALSAVYLRRYAGTLADARGCLSRASFDRLCGDAEWHLTPQEADTLWNAAVRACGGPAAEIGALWKLLRGAMNSRRAAAVHDAFRRLAAGNGFVTVEKLAAAFHAETHPDVRATRRTADEVRAEFHDTFGIASRTSTSSGAARQVTAEEFENYYADISAAVNDDATFELLIFGCWPAKEGLSTRYAERAGLSVSGSAAAGNGVVLAGASGRTTKTPLTTAEAASAAVVAEAAKAMPMPDSVLVAALLAKRTSAALSRTEHGFSHFDLSVPATAIAAARAYATSKSDMILPLLYASLRRVDNDGDGCVDAREWFAAWRESGAPLPQADADALYAAIASQLSNTPVRSLDLSRVRLPLEDAHAALRDHPLNEARRSAVVHTFNQLDRDGTGAVPIGRLVLAFNAEAHPNVATQKADRDVLQRQAAEAVGEAAKIIDARGPAVRAAGGFGTPAGAAYYGVGDGAMRLPFFEAFHEGLSVSYEDDTAFAIVLARIWSGGASGRRGRAVANPDTAREAKEATDGFLSSMERLGGAGGTAGNRSYVRGGGYATMNGSVALHSSVSSPNAFEAGGTAAGLISSEVAGSTPLRPGRPTTASAAQSPAAHRDMHPDAYDPFLIARGDRGKRHAPHVESNLRHHGSPLGGRAVSIAGSPTGTVMTRASTAGGMGAPRAGYVTVTGPGGALDIHEYRTSGNDEVDAILNMMRQQMLRRGPRALFGLIRQFEQASAAMLRLPFGELRAPMPLAAFTAIVRDASLGISPRHLDVIIRYLDPTATGSIAPARFVSLLRGGDLSSTRRDLVEHAFYHLRAIANRNAGPVDEPREDVSADEVRFGYKSANHPDVRAFKRSEDDVLREFLETFAGATHITPDGRVTLDTFTEYYATLSAFIGDDTAFSVMLYDTWELFAEDRAGVQGGRRAPPSSWTSATGSGMAGPAAGKPTQVGLATHVADTMNDLPGIAGAWSPEHRVPTRNFSSTNGMTRAQAAHTAHTTESEWAAPVRGHGLERMGYGYRQIQ